MIDDEAIKLVPTDNLVNEIKRRNPDGCIVALQLPDYEQLSSGMGWKVTFYGRPDVTLKLANICIWMHQRSFMDGVWEA